MEDCWKCNLVGIYKVQFKNRVVVDKKIARGKSCIIGQLASNRWLLPDDCDGG
jgi:hypothetical protein